MIEMWGLAMLSSDRVRGVRPVVRRPSIGFPAPAEPNPFVLPRIGMNFPQQLPYEKWLGIGRQLAAASTSSSWCLGDWLIHGENAYNGRYRDAVERTSLDYQTLRNYAWVARRFALSRRRDTLSFAHHAEVAGLPEHEQDFWLRKAEEQSWSRNRLRQEVRASLAERATGDDGAAAGPAAGSPARNGATGPVGAAADSPAAPGTDPSPRPDALPPDPHDPRIQVKLSPEQLEFCRAAADRLGRGLEEWAASALAHAAREQLDRKNRR